MKIYQAKNVVGQLFNGPGHSIFNMEVADLEKVKNQIIEKEKACEIKFGQQISTNEPNIVQYPNGGWWWFCLAFSHEIHEKQKLNFWPKGKSVLEIKRWKKILWMKIGKGLFKENV